MKILHLKRNTLLFTGSFLYCFATGILSFVLIFLLRDRFSFSAGRIGYFFSIGSFIYICSCKLYQCFGIFWKSKNILVASIASTAAAVCILAVAKNGFVVMGAWYIVQLGGGFYWAPTTAWFSQGLDEAELSKAISKFSRFWLTGSLLGSLAGGMIYSGGRAFMFLFPLLLLLVFLAGLIYYGYHSADGRGDNATGRRNDDGQKNLQIGASYRKKLHLFAIRGWVSGFCGNIITGFLPNIFPLYIRDTLGLTERAAGFILLFRGTAAVLAFTVYAKFTFWHFNRRWFFLVHTGLILFLLLLILPGRSVPLNIIVVFCIGFLYAGANNNSLFHSGADKTNPGKNMAYHEIFTYTGTIAGTLVGGFGYQHFGMFGTLLALAFIETLGLGFQILLERKTA